MRWIGVLVTVAIGAIVGVLWLKPFGGSEPRTAEEHLTALGCRSCHQVGAGFRAPVLEGLYGKKRQFKDGAFTTADEAYIVESILKPHHRLVVGYQGNMPSYAGRINEQVLMQLVEYMKPQAEIVEP